ncbi:18178_t:CDS:2, partial [Racocetra persica]
MSLTNFGIVIQEGETEFEYIYVEERVRKNILVAPSKNNFTQKSIDRVELSEFILILTNELNLNLDLIQFVKNKQIESTQCNKELIQQIEIIEQNESSNKFRII